eukprot:3801343-Amphidinium_carterae.2
MVGWQSRELPQMSGALMKWLKKNNLNEIVSEFDLDNGEARHDYVDTGLERNATWSMFVKGAHSTIYAMDETESEVEVNFGSSRRRSGMSMTVKATTVKFSVNIMS